MDTPEPHKPEHRSAMKPLLVMALLVIASVSLLTYVVNGLLRPPQVSQLAGATPAYREQGPRVTLFATSWCGYCAKAREFFARNDIAYLELDIENNADANAEHDAIGGRGVPVIVVDGKVMHGWSEAGLTQSLQIAGLLK